MMLRLKFILIGFVLGLFDCGIAIGKDYNGALSAFFFGRQPSAKAEAMGKGMVATGAGAFGAFYNPASISQNRNLVFSMSYASPYYLVTDANYKFVGATYEMGKYGFIGLSYYRSYFGEFASTSISSPDISKKNKLTTSMYTLTFSREILKGLHGGINFNLIRDKSIPVGKTYQIDFGVLKYFAINKNQKLGIGASLYNVTNSQIVYEFENNITPDIKEALPVSLHLGVSYQLWKGKSTLNSFELKTFAALLQLEYQDLLNSKYYDGFKVGAEFSLIEMIFFRLGYYTEDINDHGFSDANKSTLTDFTYGIGLEMPISKFTKGKTAIDIKLDITSMKQPTHLERFDNWDNFTIYNFSVKWKI